MHLFGLGLRMRAIHRLSLSVVLVLLWTCKNTAGVNDSDDAKTFAGVDLAAAQGEDGEELRDLLHWAIENSDAEELRKRAAAIEGEGSTFQGAKLDLQRAKELIDIVNAQPSETDLIKEAIAILKNGAATKQDYSAALRALQVFVEPIDNANDLKELDGLHILMSFLNSGKEFEADAAYVIGVAASNNVKFQNDVIEAHPTLIRDLLKLVPSSNTQSSIKSLFAISALIRNSMEIRAVFYAEGGIKAIHTLLKKEDLHLSLQRKALSLLADLLSLDKISIKDSDFVGRVLSLVDSADLDVREKAVRVLLLLSEIDESKVILHDMKAGERLVEAKQKLVQSLDTDADDYASELVELLNKLINSLDSERIPEAANKHDEL